MLQTLLEIYIAADKPCKIAKSTFLRLAGQWGGCSHSYASRKGSTLKVFLNELLSKSKMKNRKPKNI